MVKYPNYTFSVPDKRLYTLYKGTTVTPCLLQASIVSSYGLSHLSTRRLLSLIRTAPLYTSDAATCHGAPLTEPRLPFAPHLRRRTSPRHRPDPLGVRGVPPDLPSPLHWSVPDVWHFRPIRTFGAEGLHPSGSPRVGAVPAKQHSHNSSSISVIIKSLLYTQ
jgi:hypothetical protein